MKNETCTNMRTIWIGLSVVFLASCKQVVKNTTWSVYRGNTESNAWSALDQVNTKNVGQLQVAWTFHTGDSGYSIQCNPIIVDGIMYVTSPGL